MKQQFGQEMVERCKQYSKKIVKLGKEEQKLIYQVRCRRLGITPDFIKLKTSHFNLTNVKYQEKLEKYIQSFYKNNLNIHISDTHFNIKIINNIKLMNVCPLIPQGNF